MFLGEYFPKKKFKGFLRDSWGVQGDLRGSKKIQGDPKKNKSSKNKKLSNKWFPSRKLLFLMKMCKFGCNCHKIHVRVKVSAEQLLRCVHNIQTFLATQRLRTRYRTCAIIATTSFFQPKFAKTIYEVKFLEILPHFMVSIEERCSFKSGL